jgi:hypothetical protein
MTIYNAGGNMRYTMYRKLRDMEKEQGFETSRKMHRRVALWVMNATKR